MSVFHTVAQIVRFPHYGQCIGCESQQQVVMTQIEQQTKWCLFGKGTLFPEILDSQYFGKIVQMPCSYFLPASHDTFIPCCSVRFYQVCLSLLLFCWTYFFVLLTTSFLSLQFPILLPLMNRSCHCAWKKVLCLPSPGICIIPNLTRVTQSFMFRHVQWLMTGLVFAK